MTEQHILLAFLWIAYGVFHSLLASGRVKRALFERFRGLPPYYRAAYVVFALVTFFGILAFQLPLPSPRVLGPGWRVPGLVVAALGAALMAVCIKKYFLSLSGLRSLFRREALPPELRIDGVHRYVRHPLYLGTFVFIWGLFLVLPTLSFLITNLIIHAYTVIGIRFEEAKLVQDFGPAYQRYREQVPRLLPLPLRRKGARRQ